MRLSDFIISDMEAILQAWEDFARTVDTLMPVMDAEGLRNHGEYILKTVAADMRTAQTAQEQIDKSHGQGPTSADDSPAQTHAMTRLLAGFSMDQMVSEYRALRSSVLMLWLAKEPAGNSHHVNDMIRFNESIDQALVESIATYGAAVEHTRKTVLAVLGHDLRSPLGAVLMASDLLRRTDYLKEREVKLSTQIHTSVTRANHMVSDLLDLARCNLGDGIPVQLQTSNLNTVCASIADEIKAEFPLARIEVQQESQVTGEFDSPRIAQVFSNLIGNAVRHGDLAHPITVGLGVRGDRAEFTVHNSGEAIPPSAMPYLFSAQGRYSSYAAGERGTSAGLGLGLFIAAQIVEAHNGTIKVRSSDDGGTRFEVSLPIRRKPDAS